MSHVVIPTYIGAEQPRRRSIFPLSLGRPRRFSQVVEIVARMIRRSDEDDILRRYEGHSWCDSAERDINYHIMTGRRLPP